MTDQGSRKFSSIKTGAQAIVETLVENGTELVVGYIGHSTQELANELTHNSSIRIVNPVTELAGSHMVNAFNFLKRKPAAVGVWHTLGTFLITAGIYEGLASRIPSVHIGVNADGAFKDRDALQDIPNVEVFKSLTRFASRVERPDKLPEAIHRAFQRSQAAPEGPVFIDLPFDITIDEAEMTIPRGWVRPNRAVSAPAADVNRAAELLVGAKRPVLLIGGGAVLSGAGAEVRELAELVGAPVTTTYTSQGIVDETDRISMGSSGTLGWTCANDATKKADVVLIVGSRISDWGYAQAFAGDLSAKLIHIDTDALQLGNFYIPEVGIAADAKTAVRQIIDAVPQVAGFNAVPFEERAPFAEYAASKAEWLSKMSERASSDQFPLSPWRVMRDVQSQLADDDIIVTDTGNNTGWVFQGTITKKVHRLIVSFGAGVLGAGFPMAMGAKLAEPDKNVIVALGDGGFQYATNEITTAILNELPITVIVFNDGHLGANWGFQGGLYGQTSWVDLRNPDFIALAKANGGDGEHITSPDQIGAAVRRGITSGTVYVIDCPISTDFTYPATGAGPTVRWAPRRWPSDVVGTKSPDKFSDREVQRP